MTTKAPTLLQSTFPIVMLMALIGLNVYMTPDDTLGGANQLALLFASAIGVGIALYNGVKWNHILNRVIHTVSAAIPSIIILFTIGMLAGTWMLSGIVPTMIYYGLNIINPHVFLPITIILAAIISVVVGSSWSTVATIGVALMGIGTSLGFNPGIVAGAIISGAYFGDKISPLSDTTNLAATVAKVPLFTHIKYMMQTTIPSFIISLTIYIVISFVGSPASEKIASNTIQDTIANYYNISPFLLLVPVAVIWMIYKRYPSIIVLFAGALLGGAATIIAQPQIITTLAQESELTVGAVYSVVTKSMYTTTTANTGDAAVDVLLTTGGMKGMLNTVWLIISAMIFGGVLEAGHFLESIVSRLSRRIKTTGMAVTTTTGATILLNVASGDQYMSIIVPGKMFSRLFTKLRLRPELLSRTLEDSGTVTSVLIPWNTCGATQAAVLGVATMTYAPFAFFCYISPIMTLIFAWFKIKIKPLKESEAQSIED